MPDPDLETRGGGGGAVYKKIFSSPRASVWSKNRGRAPGPLAWIRRCLLGDPAPLIGLLLCGLADILYVSLSPGGVWGCAARFSTAPPPPGSSPIVFLFDLSSVVLRFPRPSRSIHYRDDHVIRNALVARKMRFSAVASQHLTNQKTAWYARTFSWVRSHA